jgi:hypothetical protein
MPNRPRNDPERQAKAEAKRERKNAKRLRDFAAMGRPFKAAIEH